MYLSILYNSIRVAFTWFWVGSHDRESETHRVDNAWPNIRQGCKKCTTGGGAPTHLRCGKALWTAPFHGDVRAFMGLSRASVAVIGGEGLRSEAEFGKVPGGESLGFRCSLALCRCWGYSTPDVWTILWVALSDKRRCHQSW